MAFPLSLLLASCCLSNVQASILENDPTLAKSLKTVDPKSRRKAALFFARPFIIQDIWFRADIARDLTAYLADRDALVRGPAAVALAEIILYARAELHQLANASGVVGQYDSRIASATVPGIDVAAVVGTLPDAFQDPEEHVRLLAAGCAAKLNPGSWSALAKLLSEDISPAVRRHTAHFLGQFGQLDAVPALVRSLDDPDYQVRQESALSLAALGARAAASALRERSRREPDSTVKATIDWAGNALTAGTRPEPSWTQVRTARGNASGYYRTRIDEAADFEALTRFSSVYFLRDTRTNQVYFFDVSRYPFHRDFALAEGLIRPSDDILDAGEDDPTGRFTAGTIYRLPDRDGFLFDVLGSSGAAGETRLALEGVFTQPLDYGPLPQDHVRASWSYSMVHIASTVGRLRIAAPAAPPEKFEATDVVAYGRAPISFPPTAGIIVTELLSPVAHSRLLLHNWRTPSGVITDANAQLHALEGCPVFFKTLEDGYILRLATPSDAMSALDPSSHARARIRMQADLKVRTLASLEDQRRADSVNFGAKSANLGEVLHAGLNRVVVPRGFTIPFSFYHEFLAQGGLSERVAAVIEALDAIDDAQYRASKLKELQEAIDQAPIPQGLSAEILSRVHAYFPVGTGLFVRSSTNAEDLPGFVGAGLYDTVPNVKGDQALLRAIKKVWASVWNYNAFQTRESFGIDHSSVYPAVIIQEGINADNSGVAITLDPFKRAREEVVFIGAKKGLGFRVVEGHESPEHILFYPKRRKTEIIGRSQDTTAIVFEEAGGVRSISVSSGGKVVDESIMEILADAALRLKSIFGTEQDVEWLTKDGRLYVVQARPYPNSEQDRPQATPQDATACRNRNDLDQQFIEYAVCRSFHQGSDRSCKDLAQTHPGGDAECRLMTNQYLFMKHALDSRDGLEPCRKWVREFAPPLSDYFSMDPDEELAVCSDIAKDYRDGGCTSCMRLAKTGDSNVFRLYFELRLRGYLNSVAGGDDVRRVKLEKERISILNDADVYATMRTSSRQCGLFCRALLSPSGDCEALRHDARNPALCGGGSALPP